MGRESPNFLPPGNENTPVQPSTLFSSSLSTQPRLAAAGLGPGTGLSGIPGLPLPWRAAAAAAVASGQTLLPGLLPQYLLPAHSALNLLSSQKYFPTLLPPAFFGTTTTPPPPSTQLPLVAVVPPATLSPPSPPTSLHRHPLIPTDTGRASTSPPTTPTTPPATTPTPPSPPPPQVAPQDLSRSSGGSNSREQSPVTLPTIPLPPPGLPRRLMPTILNIPYKSPSV